MKAIILVAGIGKRLRDITDTPKCLLRIHGLTLLERYLSALENLAILDVVLVVGYKKESIVEFVNGVDFSGNIKLIVNPDFSRGSIMSLDCVVDELDSNVLLMDGDVYFEPAVLQMLMSSEGRNLVAVDTTSTSSGEEVMLGIKDGRVMDMKRNLIGNYDTIGEAVGFYKLDRQACQELRMVLKQQLQSGKYDLGYEDILPFLFERVWFGHVAVDGLKWLEIDFRGDLRRAESLAIAVLE